MIEYLFSAHFKDLFSSPNNLFRSCKSDRLFDGISQSWIFLIFFLAWWYIPRESRNYNLTHTLNTLIPNYFFDYKVHIFTEFITAFFLCFLMFFLLNDIFFFVDIVFLLFRGWILLNVTIKGYFIVSLFSSALNSVMWCFIVFCLGYIKNGGPKSKWI